METVDGDKHVKDNKHVYNQNFLLETVDKICANHQYQCLTSIICRNIQWLGLHRRGKRGRKIRKMHLDIIIPCRAHQNNLVRVNIEINIGKYQPDKSLAISLFNAQSIKDKESTTHHQIVLNKMDILLLTEMWLTNKDTDKIYG